MEEDSNNEKVQGKSRFISIMIRIGRVASRVICISKCCISEDNSTIIQRSGSKSSTEPTTPIKKDSKFKIEL